MKLMNCTTILINLYNARFTKFWQIFLFCIKICYIVYVISICIEICYTVLRTLYSYRESHDICNECCSMSVMSEMDRSNFAQKGPACVRKLDFRPALAYIRLSNIEFFSRRPDFFSFSFVLKSAWRVTTRILTQTTLISKVKLIIAIVCMILFSTIYNYL